MSPSDCCVNSMIIFRIFVKSKLSVQLELVFEVLKTHDLKKASVQSTYRLGLPCKFLLRNFNERLGVALIDRPYSWSLFTLEEGKDSCRFSI